MVPYIVVPTNSGKTEHKILGEKRSVPNVLTTEYDKNNLISIGNDKGWD